MALPMPPLRARSLICCHGNGQRRQTPSLLRCPASCKDLQSLDTGQGGLQDSLAQRYQGKLWQG